MRRVLPALACALLLNLGAARGAVAAETLDAAVTNIAQRFVASRAGAAAPMRVAVTAFVQSDRKTTQLTNLLMIALTGKMVEFGAGAFRVIERAQLETAVREIQFSNSGAVDKDMARELGKFLGVDALIVGEITPLSDIVRIDARMIEVETIETIQQANEWVPLTPTVQRQLETVAIVARPRVGEDGPDPRNGVWNGTGVCGETSFGVAVSIIVNPDDTVTAMQTYYPLSAAGPGSDLRSGVLAMEGSIDPASGEIALSPGSWLFQPPGHTALGFAGVLDAQAGLLRANYTQDGCSALVLRRMR